MTFPGGDPRKRIAAEIRAVSAAAEDAVREVTEGTVKQAKINLTNLEKIDRGFTRASVDSWYNFAGPAKTGIAFVGAYWGVWVEFGRRGRKADPTGGNPLAATAAWPPVQVIRDWVKRNLAKLILGTKTPSGVQAKAQARFVRKAKKDDAFINSLAFLIGRKIADYGIKPAPFLVPAFNAWAPALAARIAYHLQRRRANIP